MAGQGSKTRTYSAYVRTYLVTLFLEAWKSNCNLNVWCEYIEKCCRHRRWYTKLWMKIRKQCNQMFSIDQYNTTMKICLGIKCNYCMYTADRKMKKPHPIYVCLLAKTECIWKTYVWISGLESPPNVELLDILLLSYTYDAMDIRIMWWLQSRYRS
jgi:hypothetical protein